MARRPAGKIAVVTGDGTEKGFASAKRFAEDNAALDIRRAIGKGTRGLMPWLAP
jgi:NAD(P)-dependent dehydrogenase (short-subunit alcohol dehydrogenase family)